MKFDIASLLYAVRLIANVLAVSRLSLVWYKMCSCFILAKSAGEVPASVVRARSYDDLPATANMTPLIAPAVLRCRIRTVIGDLTLLCCCCDVFSHAFALTRDASSVRALFAVV